MPFQILDWQTAKQNEDKFDYSISVGDLNGRQEGYTVKGKIDTLELNFNDIWIIDGKRYIWAGDQPHQLPEGNDQPLPSRDVLETVDAFIKKNPDFAEKNSVIHCWAGVSRSTAIALYIIMRNFNHTPEEAMNIIKSVRPIARPNLNLADHMGYGVRRYLESTVDYSKIY